MRRALKLIFVVLVVLIALAVVNALVLDSQTKPAGVTAAGGKIESVSSVDLQVFDSPATGVSFDARSSVPVLAFSVALKMSPAAVGLIGATLIVTVAVDAWPEPSVTV